MKRKNSEFSIHRCLVRWCPPLGEEAGIHVELDPTAEVRGIITLAGWGSGKGIRIENCILEQDETLEPGTMQIVALSPAEPGD